MFRPNDILRGAIEWIRFNREYFKLFRDGPDPTAHQEQALAELAILCRQLVLRGMQAQVDIAPLLAVLLDVYASPIFRHRLRRFTDAFIPHALVADALRHGSGLDWSAAQLELQEACERGNVTSVERPPHRLMELRRILDSAEVMHYLPSYAAICRASGLGRCINPIRLTDYEIYSITHTLFFLTDFGRFPLTGLTASRRQRAHETVDQLLGMQIYRGNYDLVGELMLSAHCLSSPQSDFYTAGWDVLQQARLPTGAIPGPNYQGRLEQEALARGREERDAYIFENCYHTTLVAALVGSICPNPHGAQFIAQQN